MTASRRPPPWPLQRGSVSRRGLLVGGGLAALLAACSADEQAARPLPRKVSEPGTPVAARRFVRAVEGRYFVDQDGDPILVRGDSPWALLTQASTEEMSTYLATRAQQGFNMMLLSLIGNETNGAPYNDCRTHDGVYPFVGGASATDLSRLNEPYWQRLDHLVAEAENNGITLLLYPLDGWNAISNFSGWFANKSPAQCTQYGTALASRYAGAENIVWAYGGDFDLRDTATNEKFWAAHTALADGGCDWPVTCQGLPESSNTSWWDDVDPPEPTWWHRRVDWECVYSYMPVYDKIEQSYKRSPLPALLQESGYELNGGYPTTARDMRAQVGWSLTSGSPGYFYGNEDIWDFSADDWLTRSAQSTIVTQQQHMLRTVAELPGWHLLIPDHEGTFLTGGRGTYETSHPSTYVTGARTPDGKLAVIYVPNAANAITLDQTSMGAGYTARWVDPANGESHAAPAAATYSRSATNSVGDPDWLLILQADT